MGAWPESGPVAAVGGAGAGQQPTRQPALIPNPAEFPCPRCTRHHPGGQDKCKSIDKLCR